MSGKSKQPAQEEGGGESAPLWIISFADMISLLMAFFVMLSTFNSFDKTESKKLQAVVETSMLPMGGWLQEPAGNALIASSNAATEAQGSTTHTGDNPARSGSLNRTPSEDYRKFKIFDVPSSTIFVSQTAVLTPAGKQWLDTMIQFLSKVPGGVVISEQGPGRTDESAIGRSVAILTYLKNNGIAPGRLNISRRGMLPPKRYQQQAMLEICLLEHRIKL